MTAPLKKNNYKNQGSEVCLDFMQTVQRNHTLEKRFLKYVDVNQKDVFGFTALYWAISHHNINNVRLLLNYGARLAVTDKMSAPFYAIDCDNLEVLQYFIGKGIDCNLTRVNDKGEKVTLLQYAKKLKRKEIIQYIVDNDYYI